MRCENSLLLLWDDVCVLDAGWANQCILQQSTRLEQRKHRDGGEQDEEEGFRGNAGSLRIPMDEDKPEWNQKAQSKAGDSVRSRTCQWMSLVVFYSFLLLKYSSVGVFCQWSQSTEEPSTEAGQRNDRSSSAFKETLSFQGAIDYAAFNNKKLTLYPVNPPRVRWMFQKWFQFVFPCEAPGTVQYRSFSWPRSNESQPVWIHSAPRSWSQIMQGIFAWKCWRSFSFSWFHFS